MSRYAPRGYGQDATLTTAAEALPSIPDQGSARVRLTIFRCTVAMRMRDDGTAPTTTVGYPIDANADFFYSGPPESVRLIAQAGSGVLDVLYYGL
jgi:hypothetical protein